MTPKDIKAFIKKQNAPYANGSPFDTLREDEIRKLIEKDELLFLTNRVTADNTLQIVSLETIDASELFAVVNVRELAKDFVVKDFAQRRYKLPAGSVYVKGVWFDSSLSHDLHRKIFSTISRRFRNYWLTVQLYAEDERKIETLQVAGLERALTKVSAFAEIKVLYTSTNVEALDGTDEIEDLTLEKLRDEAISSFEQTRMMGELVTARAHVQFANHYSIYNKDEKWSGISLRGYGDGQFIEKPSEMSKKWKADPANAELLARECRFTEIAADFEFTLQKLRDVFPAQTQFERIRILRLDNGGEILRHCDIQDKDAGIDDGKIARFHIPLHTQNAIVHAWDANGVKRSLHMPERSLCYLDHRKPHAVTNPSKEGVRLHLVVDVYSNAYIRQMLMYHYRKNYAKQIS